MEGSPQSQLTRIVKLQYKDYEEGEYTGIASRSFEETIRLIAEYPWEDQRDHLAIGLTNPSVTIEGQNNEFLKLSPYYNGKFVLHYFDNLRHLYTRPCEQLADTTSVIQSFFDDDPFDPSGFKKEITWLQSNFSHFRTQNFSYSLRLANLIGPFLIALFLLVASVTWCLALFALTHNSLLVVLVPLALLILLAQIAALAANHYRAAKDRLLVLSKGKEEFSFGPPEALTSFNKKDIREIITYGRTGRGGYPPLTRVEILFQNGRSLDISCLIISQETFVAKFPHCAQSVVPKFFPFINPAASALFE